VSDACQKLAFHKNALQLVRLLTSPKWIDERARGENTDTNAGIARELKNRTD